MTIKDIDYDRLASLLLLEPSLEPEPEAFRGQPDLALCVNFSSYVAFISTLGTTDYLSRPTRTLNNLVSLYHRNGACDVLFNAYLYDIACGVAKEIYYDHLAGKGATKIVHTVPQTGVPEHTLGYLLFTYKRMDSLEKTAEQILRNRMQAKGYKMPLFNELNANLQQQWAYAVYLTRSSLSNNVWSLKLT